MANSTVEKIKKIMVEYRDFDPDTITKESTFNDLGLDSLDTVDLVMQIEEEFGIEIPMDGKFKVVGDIIDFIDNAKK